MIDTSEMDEAYDAGYRDGENGVTTSRSLYAKKPVLLREYDEGHRDAVLTRKREVQQTPK